jgi:hypothetical protein
MRRQLADDNARTKSIQQQDAKRQAEPGHVTVPPTIQWGVRSMISLFSVLHALAAQRGEGLRPELVSLLERSGAQPELPGSNAVLPGSGLLREDVRWFLVNG